MNKRLPEPTWAVNGLLGEGISILAGTKSVGKSWLALSLAMAIVSGEPALGKIPVGQGIALYLALKDGERRMQRRLQMYLDGKPMLRGFALVYTSPPMGKELYDNLGYWMDDYPETRLIVVDLFANIYTPPGSKDAYFSLYRALGGLRRVVDDLTVPLLLLHHTNQRTDDQLADPFDRILGGQGMKGPVTGCLVDAPRAAEHHGDAGRDREGHFGSRSSTYPQPHRR
jgi:AAA domain